MLLEFKAKNYKSFKEELVFSLVPAPKQKGLDYSILEEKIGRKTYKAPEEQQNCKGEVVQR